MGKVYTRSGDHAVLTLENRQVRESTTIENGQEVTVPAHTTPVLAVSNGSIASTGASGKTKVLDAREVRLSQSDVNAWRDSIKAGFAKLDAAGRKQFDGSISAYALTMLNERGFATTGQETERASAIDSLFADESPAEGESAPAE